MPWEWDSLASFGFGSGNDVTRGGSKKKRTKKEEEFARKRWQFLAVVAVGVVGWGVGTGAIPLPGRLGRVLQDEDEWEEEEDDDDVVVVEI